MGIERVALAGVAAIAHVVKRLVFGESLGQFGGIADGTGRNIPEDAIGWVEMGRPERDEGKAPLIFFRRYSQSDAIASGDGVERAEEGLQVGVILILLYLGWRSRIVIHSVVVAVFLVHR